MLLEKSIHIAADYYYSIFANCVVQNYINNARNRFLTVHGHIIFDLKHVALCGFHQVHFTCCIWTCLVHEPCEIRYRVILLLEAKTTLAM